MRFQVQTPSRVIELLASVLLAAGVVPAWAAEVHQFDIPEEAASAAIRDFGDQAHVQILAAGDAVNGKKFHAVQGELSTEDALNTLLSGSGLTHKYVGNGSIALLPMSTAGQQSTTGTSDQQTGKGGQGAPASSFLLAQATPGEASSSPSVEGQNEAEQKEEQKKREQLQVVVVTGTHIEGSENPTAPLLVIDRAEIERSGYTTVQQLVDSIPQNFRGGSAAATEDGFLGSGGQRFQNDNFGTGINLRGLGPSSTLVLIDGHRLAPSAEGIFTDISVIPLAAIERVEIMTDGASAIYGADAVAGVVNFILRRNYSGQETWANYGSDSDGTRPQELIGQSVGRDWSTGNAFGAVQYQKLGALNAADRSFTASSPDGTDLLPKSEQYSAVLNARQELGSGFDIASELLFSHKKDVGSQGDPTPFVITNSSSTDAGVATVDLGYRIADTWRVDATGSYSREHVNQDNLYTPLQPFCDGFADCLLDDNFSVWSGDLVVNGTLFSAPGGDVKAAFGGSYRNETLGYVTRNWTTFYPSAFDRHVFAEYAELEVPLVGAGNARPLLRKLDLSLAVRHDDYSDFGATTNPRYGLAWKPAEPVRIRAAYSTSFRAPNAWEDSAAVTQGRLFQLPWASPSGGAVPVLYWTGGGGPPLRPETSRNVTGGLDLQPQSVPDFTASADYFYIRYRDRISTPPIDAAALSELNVFGSAITQLPDDASAQQFINTFMANGGLFHSYFGPPGVGVRYVLNHYLQNLAEVRTDGVDLSVKYHLAVQGNDFRVRVDAAHLNEILTSVTDTSTPTDVANTYGNPLRWRGRAQLDWSRGPWSLATAANYTGSYTDTTTVPYAAIGSWVTLDMQLAYALSFVKGGSVSLSCTNLLNRDPPYVAGNSELGNAVGNAIHYDVANANPLGRVVILSARVSW